MVIYGSDFDPSALFVSAADQQLQLESIAGAALSAGIDHYTNKRYAEAAEAFGRSVALSPTSPNATTAAEYQASSYIKLGRMDKAVDAYERAIRLDPQNDASLVKLGNLFFTEERYKDAETVYQKAALLNPTHTNHYSLGQAQLATGNYTGAERSFETVTRLIPDQPNGYFGLGQAYAKQELYDRAVEQFEIAIEKDPEFYSSYLELGYTLADAGRMADAQVQHELLNEKDAGLADQLDRYLYKVDTPKIMFASAMSSFNYTMPMRTQLSALDSYLAAAGAEKSFNMIFQFDKEMDRESVENIYNWSIRRADGTAFGDRYNFGLSIDPTEVTLPPYPDNVYYDADNFTATVRFTLTQNATSDATIDPSHVVFRFNGKDRFGNTMDPASDEFSGFSRIA